MSVLVVGQILSSNMCDFPLTVFQLYQMSVICCNDGIAFFWSFLSFFCLFFSFFFIFFFSGGGGGGLSSSLSSFFFLAPFLLYFISSSLSSFFFLFLLYFIISIKWVFCSNTSPDFCEQCPKHLQKYLLVLLSFGACLVYNCLNFGLI